MINTAVERRTFSRRFLVSTILNISICVSPPLQLGDGSRRQTHKSVTCSGVKAKRSIPHQSLISHRHKAVPSAQQMFISGFSIAVVKQTALSGGVRKKNGIDDALRSLIWPSPEFSVDELSNPLPSKNNGDYFLRSREKRYGLFWRQHRHPDTINKLPL